LEGLEGLEAFLLEAEALLSAQLIAAQGGISNQNTTPADRTSLARVPNTEEPDGDPVPLRFSAHRQAVTRLRKSSDRMRGCFSRTLESCLG
jgi:hypothetical protein